MFILKVAYLERKKPLFRYKKSVILKNEWIKKHFSACVPVCIWLMANATDHETVGRKHGISLSMSFCHTADTQISEAILGLF